ncbi:hypothetical protein [Streptomyces sp. RFCAC02]|uniref:hypothetical protein n=1 Tax=Streptomyces sp. RFCAC02 TaxID=2499143 RepID=UPI00102114A5|nr:hypothetical protein [Streptomyces sp. RFCAC02]
MRKAIRLALPVVAAVTALSLTACGDDSDSDDNASGSDTSAAESGGSESTDDSGDGATEEAGGEEGTGTEEDAGGGDFSGIPASDALQGLWSAGIDTPETSPVLSFTDVMVVYMDDGSGTGNTCTGTLGEQGHITLESCVQGENERTGMTGEVTSDDSGTIRVTWASGVTEDFTQFMDGDGEFTDPELAEQFDSLEGSLG